MLRTAYNQAQLTCRAGQASVELAAFGAVLIFVLGTIVRSAIGNSYTQDENFKTMRQAMVASWTGTSPVKSTLSRNSASVFLLEDRLSPDASKYGATDRNPYVSQGSGTFSFKLFYPLDVGDDIPKNVPVMDMYINGQHFPLTQAAWFKDQALAPPASCTYPAGSCQQNQCLRQQREWVKSTDGKSTYKLFYTRVPRGVNAFTSTPPACSSQHPVNKELCRDLSLQGPSDTTATTNTNGDLMFDLSRNGNNAQIESQYAQECPSTPLSGRCNVAWEWAASAAVSNAAIGLNVANAQYPTYDINGSLKESTIYKITPDTKSGTLTASYIDPTAGDIDGTWDTTSCGPKPGLQNLAQIFTFTKDGTYLQIKEGQLYNPETDQFVRSANKRDTIDLIQRVIQLSANTGRFCSGTSPQPCVDGDCTANPDPNPVTVCTDGSGCPGGDNCNCFSTETNIKSTCFDETNNMLFVRSRLEDQRGQAWMTDVQGQLKVQ